MVLVDQWFPDSANNDVVISNNEIILLSFGDKTGQYLTKRQQNHKMIKMVFIEWSPGIKNSNVIKYQHRHKLNII